MLMMLENRLAMCHRNLRCGREINMGKTDEIGGRFYKNIAMPEGMARKQQQHSRKKPVWRNARNTGLAVAQNQRRALKRILAPPLPPQPVSCAARKPP